MNTPTTGSPTSAAPSNSFAAAAFDTAFASLLQTWNSHQQLKDEKADLGDLWSSHCSLFDERQVVAQARTTANE